MGAVVPRNEGRVYTHDNEKCRSYYYLSAKILNPNFLNNDVYEFL